VFNKVFQIGLIVAGVIGLILFTTVMMPFFISMSNVVVNDTTVGNYWGYKSLGQTLPLWFYGLPILVGFFAVMAILKIRRRGNE
jgi:hypothetical protein